MNPNKISRNVGNIKSNMDYHEINVYVPSRWIVKDFVIPWPFFPSNNPSDKSFDLYINTAYWSADVRLFHISLLKFLLSV